MTGQCSGLTQATGTINFRARLAGAGRYKLGSTLEQKAQQNADILAFIAESLGVSLAAPPASAEH